jgi:hypothetical protein
LATFHAFQPLTCFKCTKILQAENDTQIKTDIAHEERGDEEEFHFTGIPIAGEHDGNSVESWEYAISRESEDEFHTQNHTWFSHVQGVNISATDDLTRMGLFMGPITLPSLSTPIPTATF